MRWQLLLLRQRPREGQIGRARTGLASVVPAPPRDRGASPPPPVLFPQGIWLAHGFLHSGDIVSSARSLMAFLYVREAAVATAKHD